MVISKKSWIIPGEFFNDEKDYIKLKILNASHFISIPLQPLVYKKIASFHMVFKCIKLKIF